VCEQYIKEGKLALSWTRLSCTRFAPNRVRLALFVLAYTFKSPSQYKDTPYALTGGF
jgi:hypothetical protein